MIEIRWVTDDSGSMQLQQRTRSVFVDAAGAFCGFAEWSDWQAVPIVHDSNAFADFADVFGTKS